MAAMTKRQEKYARSSRTLLAHALMAKLRKEVKLEASLQRFDQYDDTPNLPEADPLSSAQSRRAKVLA